MMTVKVNTMRDYLASDGVQVSTDAAAYLAFTMDQRCREISAAVLQRLDEENRARAIQGIEPRRRITVDDVRSVLG